MTLPASFFHTGHPSCFLIDFSKMFTSLLATPAQMRQVCTKQPPLGLRSSSQQEKCQKLQLHESPLEAGSKSKTILLYHNAQIYCRNKHACSQAQVFGWVVYGQYERNGQFVTGMVTKVNSWKLNAHLLQSFCHYHCDLHPNQEEKVASVASNKRNKRPTECDRVWSSPLTLTRAQYNQ